VYGDGSQTRSFGHVHEIADALVRLMDHPGAPGQAFNVGNPREVRIIEVARRIIELTDSPSRIQFVPFDVAYEPGFEEIMRRVPDVGKLQRAIGFEPQFGLDEILESVIDAQKQRQVAV
jgi:UDP-glucose 4-epimerase